MNRCDHIIRAFHGISRKDAVGTKIAFLWRWGEIADCVMVNADYPSVPNYNFTLNK